MYAAPMRCASFETTCTSVLPVLIYEMLASFTAEVQLNLSAATAILKTSSGARLSGTALFRKCIMLQIIHIELALSSGIRTSFGSLLLGFWPLAKFGLNRLEKYVEERGSKVL
jgi:hypothetical protein